MTPREIIKRNMEFSGPQRIGFVFPGDRLNDFCKAGIGPSGSWQQKRRVEDGIEYYDDEWGNMWHRVADGSVKGEIFRPALEDWAELDRLRMPDFALADRYSQAAAAFSSSPGKYRVGGVPGFPFAICRYLRKMEVYFQDLVLERKNIDALHARVTGLLEEVIRRWAEAGADAVMFAEDWGTQRGLLISPAMWREIFFPLYRRLCRRAAEGGLHVIMHSCGYNREILRDLVEAGINCFQFDQPALYGLRELAGLLKEIRVCLYSPVDVQRVLPGGDAEKIAEHARLMVELFGKPDGGFIAATYGDLAGIGAGAEAEETAYRTFYRHRFI